MNMLIYIYICASMYLCIYIYIYIYINLLHVCKYKSNPSAVCVPVEWRIVSLRVLSEITLLLLSQDEVEERERDGGREREAEWEGEGISSNTRLLTLISEALLPQ